MSTELAPVAVATDDDRLFQAEALVRSYCGWHIAPERDDTYIPRGVGPAYVFLPSLKVTALSVTVNAAALVDNTDFWWDAFGCLRLNYWGTDAIEVTFTHGFEDPPEDVTAVVQAVAARAVDNPRSLTSRTVGPFSEAYGSGSVSTSPLSLWDAEKAILAPYRIIKVM